MADDKNAFYFVIFSKKLAFVTQVLIYSALNRLKKL